MIHQIGWFPNVQGCSRYPSAARGGNWVKMCPEIILETLGDPKLSMVHPKLSGFLTCECNRHRIKDAKVEKTMVTICHILPKPMSKGRWG